MVHRMYDCEEPNTTWSIHNVIPMPKAEEEVVEMLPEVQDFFY